VSPVVYRMTVRSNPRILVIVTVIPVILLAGIGMLVLLGMSYGLIALVLAMLAAWSVLRFIRYQLAACIETTEDQIVVTRRGGEKIHFPWNKVRLSGIATPATPRRRTPRNTRNLFVYNQQDDRLISVTDEFEDLDGLAAELRARTDFRNIALSRGETLNEKLRELAGHG
jgi:hypothetical protein